MGRPGGPPPLTNTGYVCEKQSVLRTQGRINHLKGALKMLDVKMTNVKLTDHCAGDEIADGPNDRT